MKAADVRVEKMPQPTGKPRTPSMRSKVLYSSIIVLVLLLLAETLAQVALRVAYGPRVTEGERLQEYDSQLGWANMKNRRVPDRYGPNKHATHNSLGLRATHEFTASIPPGRFRISVLGDSYTYGVDVGDADTFVAQLESLAAPIEAVNMGVPGYGIDQMYLLYNRAHARMATDLLVLAFIDDDLRRTKLSAFMTRFPKPRLRLNGDALTVVNVPVPTWGPSTTTGLLEEFPNRTAVVQVLRSAYDMFLQDYDPFPVVEHIVSDLNRLSREKRQHFALVYLPSKTDMGSDQRTEAARHLQEFTARDHVPFFDLTEKLKSATKRQGMPVFGADGRHYSETGYKVIAASLLDELRKAFPDVPR